MKIESRVQYRNNIMFIFQKCFKTGNKIIFIKMNVSFNFNLLIYEHALSTDFVSAILLLARIVCLFFCVFFSFFFFFRFLDNWSERHASSDFSVDIIFISFNDFGTTIFVRYIILCNNSNLLLQIFSKF